jgi:hypothetical protein
VLRRGRIQRRGTAPARTRRLGRHSITSKLLGSLLLLTTVSVAALAVMYWDHRTMRASMRELTRVAEPLDAATHEIEINAIGSGLAVAHYLRTGDPAQRVRLENNEGDFRRASRRNARLADTIEEQRLGVGLRRMSLTARLPVATQGTSTERRKAPVSSWPSARASADGGLPTPAGNTEDDQ